MTQRVVAAPALAVNQVIVRSLLSRAKSWEWATRARQNMSHHEKGALGVIPENF